MTDEEKIAKLQEEKQKLTENLASVREETREIENKIEKVSFQYKNIKADKKQ